MGRKIALLYTVFSILALVVLSVWTTYSLLQTKSRNLAAATGRFEALTRDIASEYTSSGGYETDRFRSFVRSLFLSDPTIEVLLIESPDSGLQYLFARHAGYIQNPDTLGSSWHGSIVYNATLERLFSAPLHLSSHPHAQLQAVYAIFNKESLYPTLQPLLVALLGFVLLTGIVIALISILRAGRPPAPAAEVEAPRKAPAGPPEADEPNVAFQEAARESAPSDAPQAPPTPPPEPNRESAETEVIPEEGEGGFSTVERWSALAEEVVPLELEGDRPPAARTHAPASESRAPEVGELPPGVVLPSLEEIGVETAPEIDVRAVKVAEPEGAAADERRPSAEDELADIEDFEDLETIDGSAPSGEEERDRRPSGAPRRHVPPRTSEPEPSPAAPHRPEPPPAPESFALLVPDDEVAELEEITDELDAAAAEPKAPAESSPRVKAPDDDRGGLLKRLLAQGGARGAAGRAQAEETTPAEPGSNQPADRGSPHGLFAPETGLGWSEYFEKRLSFEIDRCASFDQDLSIALMRCRTPIGSPARRELARQILLNFTFQDLCFEYGADGFAVILPNLDIDGTLRKLETFQGRIAEEEEDLPALCIGLAARNGRLLPGARLRSEADGALAKALASPTVTIVAARVEPGVYRRHA